MRHAFLWDIPLWDIPLWDIPSVWACSPFLRGEHQSKNFLFRIGSLTFLFPMHLLSTPLKHFKVFWCFQGIERGRTGNKWVKNWSPFLDKFLCPSLLLFICRATGTILLFIFVIYLLHFFKIPRRVIYRCESPFCIFLVFNFLLSFFKLNLPRLYQFFPL